MSRPRKGNNPEIAALRRDIERLRAQLEEFREAHETLRAVHEGEVDALVISRPEGDCIFTLESAEQPYRLLIEQMQEAAVTLGQDGSIQYANRAFAEMLQRPLEQVIGSALETHVVAADQPAVAALLVQRHGRIEVALQAADGTHIPVQASASVVGPHGTDHICLVVTDLTERKRVERRLRATFDNAASGIAEIDADDRLMAVNDRLCRMLGYAREELLGKSVQELTYPPDRPRTDELSAQVHAGPLAEFQHEKRYVRKDGSLLWAHVAVSAVRDAAGRYLYSVGTIVDVSARKAAEARVRLQATALEAAPNAISISETDRQGTIVWVNRAFTTLTGYSAEEAIGHSHHLLSSGRHDEAFYRNLWGTLERGEVWRGELTNRRKDGTLYQEEMGITPLRDAEGRVTHFVAVKQDITARKQAEEKLQESEHRLRLAQQVARVGTFDWDLQADHDVWTPELEALYGLQPGEFAKTGKAWADLIHPEDRAKAWQLSEQSIRTGEPATGEWRVVWPDGSVHWLAGRWQVFKSPSGKPLRMTGVNIDITARKQAEEALRESERQLRFVCESIPHMVWAARPDGYVDYLNQRVFDYTGAKYEDMAGWDWLPLIHPEDRQQTTEQWRIALRDGSEVKLYYRMRHGRSGEYRWHAVHALPLRDSEGRITRWYGTCTDIDEQRRAEEALRESEAQFRDLAEALPQFVWITGPDGGVEYVNRQWYQYTGASPEQTWGRGWVQWLHPEDQQQTVERWNHSVRTGEPFEIEYRFRRASDGAYRWLLTRGVPVRDQQGRTTRWFGTCTDIEEQKRAEERLEQHVRQRTVDLAKALAEAEQGRATLEALLESIPEGITIGDAADYRLRRVSRYVGQILGVDIQTLEGTTSAEYLKRWETLEADGVTPVRLEGLPLVQAIQEGKTIEGRELVLHRSTDGAKVPILCNAAPIRDRNGRITGGVVAWRDMTEQKRAQEALRQSEHRYRTVGETIPYGVWQTDAAGACTYISDSFLEMTGLTWPQLQQFGWLHLLPAEDRQPTQDHWLRCVRSGEDFEREHRFRAADGTTRFVLAIGRPVRDEEGKTVSWVGINLDITDRKRAEAAVRESEERLRFALEACHIGAWDIDLVDHTAYRSLEHDRIFGYTELLPQWTLEDFLRHALPEYRDEVEAMVRQATAARTGWTYECRIRRADGEIRWIWFTGSHRTDASGRSRVVGVVQDITERKRNEEALRESEGNLQNFLNTTATGLVRNSRDLRYRSANTAYAEIAGRPVEQILGRSLGEVLGEQALEKIRPYIERVLQGERVEYEVELPFAGSGPRWIHAIYTPDRDAAGEVVGWVGSITDITKRKRAEEALQESEGRYRSLFDSMTEGFGLHELIFDAEGKPCDFRFLELNAAWEKETGVPREMVVGKTMKQVWPNLAPHWLEIFSKVAVTGEPIRYENCNNEWQRWYETFVYSTKPNQFALLFINITKRKRAEEGLRQQEAELREAQRVAHLGNWYWDAKTDATTGSDELLRLYGFDPATQTMPDFNDQRGRCYPVEDWERINAAVQRALQTGEGYELDVRVLRSGTAIWATSRGEVVRDAAGRIVALRGTVQDITERKQAEEMAAARQTAELARAAAEQANQAKDHFLAVLSHELRTPLTPVLPVLEELARHVSEEDREDVEMAHRNVELEARLIDDLLDVTRIARGKIELHREQVELCTIVRRAAEVCAPDIEARRLHFGIKVEGGPFAVDADPARLQQVFWNLIKNAVKFTPHGGCVGIHCQRRDGQVVAEVKDSGMGIEPEALARIFNAFEQVDRTVTRQFGGLGLGLAISRALVEMHGGTIRAHSEGKGKGTTFTVTLPILKGTAGEVVRPKAAPATRAAAATRPLVILLVEDHGDTARIMRRMLQARGHHVEAAGDVATALKLAQERDFDLVLSDLGLPDRSGLELMQELRRMGQRMPSIALSGYGQSEDIRRSKEAGFGEHLTKPVNLGQLEAAIGRVAMG